MLIHSELWQIYKTHAYALELRGGTLAIFKINIFHPGQHVKSTCTTPPLHFPYSLHLDQCQRTKQLYFIGVFFVACIQCIYSKEGRSLPPHGCWWHKPPPCFVPGLLGAQDQCPPGWQMALMKLDNSAYMHKRMLNIDSEDQRSGAYSTL